MAYGLLKELNSELKDLAMQTMRLIVTEADQLHDTCFK